jgi:hypothetical protein
MLFDLRGKRRRAVQATYLTLAFLMGGGLVFFGIGGGTSGGLLDAFKGGGKGGGNSIVQKEIKRDEARVRRNPHDTAALADLVRRNYQLAGQKTPSNSSGFSKDAKGDLEAAGRWWQRYLAAVGKPDPSLASLATQLYAGLGKAKQAEQAGLIVAQASKNPNDYLRVVQFAAAAGDSRTADLATQKAVDLAPKSQRAQVKQLAKQARSPAGRPQPQGG